jgi:hypothetical protein
MLLSRFWYVFLGLVLGALVFVLYLAQSMYNRALLRNMSEGLQADSQVVSWYLKNDARERSAHLIKFTLEDNIAKFLAKSSSSDDKVPGDARDKVLQGLNKVAVTIPKDQAFDAVFAVDQHGRVVAHLGYEQASGMEDFELGGYPVVADALHGYIRDDTLVLDRVYRVVARPVEFDLGQMPAGAIIGARIIDDRFARELSDRTGAAVAFYAKGERVAAGAPEGFEKSQLDYIVNDLKEVSADNDYKTKGRSSVRTLGEGVSFVYTRLAGEAWDLGAGYVVGREAKTVASPVGFFKAADDKDQGQANVIVVALVLLGALGLGLLFSYFEHSRPLVIFQTESRRLAKGETDQLAPSKFRGIYRTIASDINDGLDAAIGKGGGTRRAADLQQVLGDLPAEPQMSAFSLPDDSSGSAAALPSAPGGIAAVSGPSNPLPSAPRASNGGLPKPPAPPGRRPPLPPRPSAGDGADTPPAAEPQAPAEDADWQRVYEEFVATKERCGEHVEGFTFDKFRNTLQKNQDAIIKRHGVKRVRFSVYVKDGKAALKASPIKD